jgi:hypothetical protein
MCQHEWGGLGGALHLTGASYDITPDAVVRKEDGTVYSPGGETLHYRSLGVQAAYGYAYSTNRDPQELAIYLELTPFIGGGGAQAETSGANSGGTVIRRSGYGYFYEVGVRGGLYLTERHFIIGVTSFFTTGTGRVTIDLPGGAKSTLTADREGFGFGIEAGWRF